MCVTSHPLQNGIFMLHQTGRYFTLPVIAKGTGPGILAERRFAATQVIAQDS